MDPKPLWPGRAVEFEELQPYLENRKKLRGQEGKLLYISAAPFAKRNAELNCQLRLVWLLEGEMMVEAAFDGIWEKRRLITGDTLICGHSGWNNIDRGQLRHYRALSIIFHLHHIRIVYNEKLHGGREETRYYHTLHPATGVCALLLEALNGILQERATFRDSRIRSLLPVIIEQVLLDIRAEESGRLDTPRHRQVAAIMQYLQRNFHRPINCSTVCEALNLNRSYASNLFHRQTGKAMKEYLLSLRMEEAAGLLIYPDLNIGEIARQCSFENLSYFIKQFKHYYRMTPGEFRKWQPNRQLSVPEE